MSIAQNSPSICVCALPGGQATRVYALGSTGLIREFCQDSVDGPWYQGALDQKHQGSGSVSAVAYTNAAGVNVIEVYTIYASRINCYVWDGRSWSGGRTANYGQDHVFASRESGRTVLLTRNPAAEVLYQLTSSGLKVGPGPSLS